MANERRGKVLQAEELYLNALKLDENNPDALHRYSDLLADAGRLKDALAVRQKLQAVEPFVPVFNAQTAEFYWLNGQNDAAIAMLRDLPPSAPNRTAFLAMIYGSMGRYRDAADTLAETPTGMYLPGVAESAARLMRTAPAKTASPAALPVLGYLGYVYLYIGASDRVLDHYQATIDAGYLGGGLTASIWHPSSVAIRKSKRFKAFVRKAGFVEYWRAKGWPPQCHPITGDDFVCE
jgi:tetratricopeptide (TPR) repeat protein